MSILRPNIIATKLIRWHWDRRVFTWWTVKSDCRCHSHFVSFSIISFQSKGIFLNYLCWFMLNLQNFVHWMKWKVIRYRIGFCEFQKCAPLTWNSSREEKENMANEYNTQNETIALIKFAKFALHDYTFCNSTEFGLLCCSKECRFFCSEFLHRISGEKIYSNQAIIESM